MQRVSAFYTHTPGEVTCCGGGPRPVWTGRPTGTRPPRHRRSYTGATLPEAAARDVRGGDSGVSGLGYCYWGPHAAYVQIRPKSHDQIISENLGQRDKAGKGSPIRNSLRPRPAAKALMLLGTACLALYPLGMVAPTSRRALQSAPTRRVAPTPSTWTSTAGLRPWTRSIRHTSPTVRGNGSRRQRYLAIADSSSSSGCTLLCVQCDAGPKRVGEWCTRSSATAR